jgi:CheY-like chemotaxis protein
MGMVLVACDDIALQQILTAELEAHEHTVITASTGQEVHERTLAANPDIIFLTVSLPVFSGLETVQVLRQDPQVPPELPIILVLTSDVGQGAIRRAKVTDVLPVQHSAAEVLELLSRYLPPEALP